MYTKLNDQILHSIVHMAISTRLFILIKKV